MTQEEIIQRNEAIVKPRKAQCIICKCGNVYCVSVEPHCYTSKSFLKEIKEGLKNGASIEMMSIEEAKLKFNPCNCK